MKKLFKNGAIFGIVALIVLLAAASVGAQEGIPERQMQMHLP